MKVQIIGLGCFLLIFCSLAYCDEDNISHHADSIVDIYHIANIACREYSDKEIKTPEERDSANKIFQNTLVRADSEIQHIIATLVEARGDFETILTETNEIIIWREFPKDNSHAKRMEFEYGKELHDPRLRINYMSWPGIEGEIFYLLQNAFWNLRENGIRIIPSTYVLILRDGHVSLQEFIKGPFSLSGGETPYPLGAVHWGKGQTDMLILRGPAGSGSFSHYFLYTYNAQLKRFEVERKIAETDGVVDYAYTAKSNELRYKRLAPVPSTYIQDVRCQMCGTDSPLRLEISAIQDVRYNSDYAPIEIDFCNSGLQPVKFGNAYNKDEKGYIGGFSVKLHKNDGTLVLKALGVAAEKPLETDAFQVNPNDKTTFTLDIAQLYDTAPLEAGDYKLYISFLTTNPVTSDFFSGMLKSNIIDFVVDEN